MARTNPAALAQENRFRIESLCFFFRDAQRLPLLKGSFAPERSQQVIRAASRGIMREIHCESRRFWASSLAFASTARQIAKAAVFGRLGNHCYFLIIKSRTVRAAGTPVLCSILVGGTS